MELALAITVAVVAAMAGAWAVQRLARNASWVDAIWTFATGLAGAAWAFAGGAPTPAWRREAIAALAVLWALRLGLHICARAAKGQEDPRYTVLRERWGAGYEARLFGFLQIQALVAFLLALCVWLAARPAVVGLRGLDIAGALVIAVSYAGEALSDAQLARFRADPANRGKVCDAGLWGWSRHPNYFFEWLGWTGYVLFALDFSGAPGAAWGFAALIGPAMMYWLLVHVSGVPPLEQAMAGSRGAAFAAYQRRVSVFIPRPPKRSISRELAP